VKPTTIPTLTEIREAYARNIVTCEDQAADCAVLARHEQANALLKKASIAKARVEALDDAIKSLTIRQKRAAFVPPTLEEAQAYAAEHLPAWTKDGVASWWDHFDSCNWLIGKGGKRMTKWQSAIRNGFRNWKRDNKGGVSVVTTTKAKDDSWAAFLSATGQPKTEMRLASEPVLQAFEKWRKAR